MSDFDAWVREGMKQGWCGPPVCAVHDGTPYSEEEEQEFEVGGEPCIHMIRLYTDPADKSAVEENHAPSVWRATNMGVG